MNQVTAIADRAFKATRDEKPRPRPVIRTDNYSTQDVMEFLQNILKAEENEDGQPDSKYNKLQAWIHNISVEKFLRKRKRSRNWHKKLYANDSFQDCVKGFVDQQKMNTAYISPFNGIFQLTSLLQILTDVANKKNTPHPAAQRMLLDAPSDQGKTVLDALRDLKEKFPAYAEDLALSENAVNKTKFEMQMRRHPGFYFLAEPGTRGEACNNLQSAWRGVAVRSLDQVVPKGIDERYATIAGLCRFSGFTGITPGNARSIILAARKKTQDKPSAGILSAMK